MMDAFPNTKPFTRYYRVDKIEKTTIHPWQVIKSTHSFRNTSMLEIIGFCVTSSLALQSYYWFFLIIPVSFSILLHPIQRVLSRLIPVQRVLSRSCTCPVQRVLSRLLVSYVFYHVCKCFFIFSATVARFKLLGMW